MSDIQDIDEIVDTPTAVQLVFHVRRDWLGDADEAMAEAYRKADACRRFLLSPEFKARFGQKPGTLVLKASRPPPGEVLADMARLGADVVVGNLPVLGDGGMPTVACGVCGRGGFVNTQMSMTERGLTCPTCFNAWSMRASNAADSGSLSGGFQWWRILIVVFAIVIPAMIRACH